MPLRVFVRVLVLVLAQRNALMQPRTLPHLALYYSLFMNNFSDVSLIKMANQATLAKTAVAAHNFGGNSVYLKVYPAAIKMAILT